MCCVDPYKRHRDKVYDNTQTLDTKYIVYLKQVDNLQLNSGDKVCSVCLTLLERSVIETALLTYKEENSLDAKSDSQVTESTPSSIYESSSQKRKTFNETLSHFNIPCIKRQKLSDDRLVTKGVEVAQNIVCQVSKSFEDAHNVQLPNLNSLSILSKESLWFRSIIENITLKFQECKTFDEKVSLLTLLPGDWNLKNISPYFKCSYHMLSESKKLKQHFGKLTIKVFNDVIFI